jgi:hypothetical protein
LTATDSPKRCISGGVFRYFWTWGEGLGVSIGLEGILFMTRVSISTETANIFGLCICLGRILVSMASVVIINEVFRF